MPLVKLPPDFKLLFYTFFSEGVLVSSIFFSSPQHELGTIVKTFLSIPDFLPWIFMVDFFHPKLTRYLLCSG